MAARLTTSQYRFLKRAVLYDGPITWFPNAVYIDGTNVSMDTARQLSNMKLIAHWKYSREVKGSVEYKITIEGCRAFVHAMLEGVAS